MRTLSLLFFFFFFTCEILSGTDKLRYIIMFNGLTTLAALKCVSSCFTYFLQYSEVESCISLRAQAHRGNYDTKWKKMAGKVSIGRRFRRKCYGKNSKLGRTKAKNFIKKIVVHCENCTDSPFLCRIAIYCARTIFTNTYYMREY